MHDPAQQAFPVPGPKVYLAVKDVTVGPLLSPEIVLIIIWDLHERWGIYAFCVC